MPRILVVEDTPSHMAEAQRIAAEMGIELVMFESAMEARQELTSLFQMVWTVPDDGWHHYGERYPNRESIDGVITDIYMPLNKGKYADTANQPNGILVAAQAKTLGIPVVFCTAGYHHGQKYQLFHELSYAMSIHMVEGHYDYRHENEDSPTKEWGVAFRIILEEIKRTRKTESATSSATEP